MGRFQVVNPYIDGTMNTEFKSDDAQHAALSFWQTFTSNKYMSNFLPKFCFSMQDKDSKKLYHFMASEKHVGGNAEYKIEPMELKLSSEESSSFLKAYENIKHKLENDSKSPDHKGGKKSKRKKFLKESTSSSDDSTSSSSDSDDSDDEIYRHIRHKKQSPIKFMWYFPSLFKVEDLFTPAFVSPIKPIVQIQLPNMILIGP
jgi:hypothetical protein